VSHESLPRLARLARVFTNATLPLRSNSPKDASDSPKPSSSMPSKLLSACSSPETGVSPPLPLAADPTLCLRWLRRPELTWTLARSRLEVLSLSFRAGLPSRSSAAIFSACSSIACRTACVVLELCCISSLACSEVCHASLPAEQSVFLITGSRAATDESIGRTSTGVVVGTVAATRAASREAPANPP